MVGAASPETVTHGFSLNDSRWIYGMLHEKTNPKIIENRPGRFAPGWYAVSLTLSAYTGVFEEKTFRTEFTTYQSERYENGRVFGLVKIGYSLPQAACKGHRWSAPDYPVANIITETLAFDAPGPKVRGTFNFTTFPLKESQKAVRTQATIEAAAGNRRRTHAQTALPEQKGVWDSPARKAAKAAKTGKAVQAIRFHLAEHAPKNGKQVPKKSTAGPQAGAIAKRAQATVKAFRSSPSLRAA